MKSHLATPLGWPRATKCLDASGQEPAPEHGHSPPSTQKHLCVDLDVSCKHKVLHGRIVSPPSSRSLFDVISMSSFSSASESFAPRIKAWSAAGRRTMEKY